MAQQTLTLTADARNLVARFKVLPMSVRTGIVKGLRGALLAVEDKVRTGTGLRWRRGAAGLAGRLTSYSRLGGTLGVDAAIGFRKTAGFPYELAQEFGAKAAPGKAMAIPVSPEARKLSQQGQGPRAFPKPLVLIKGMGKAMLMEARPRTMELHYVLVKSIPARLKFREIVYGQARSIEEGVVTGYREGIAHAP